MFIDNEKELKDVKQYTCGSPNLRKFLEQNGLAPIYSYQLNKERKNRTMWVFIMTDEFVKRNETKSPEERVKEFAAKQRKVLKELNFKNTQEFIDFCKDPKNKLPNLNTVTTQEEFDALVKLIKECR